MALKTTLIALACAGTWAGTAQAQQTCLPRDSLVEKLAEKYSERLIGRGLQGTARLFEVFMSADGSSWTLLQSFPNGTSCIMAAGTDWHQDDLAVVFSLEG